MCRKKGWEGNTINTEGNETYERAQKNRTAEGRTITKPKRDTHVRDVVAGKSLAEKKEKKQPGGRERRR